MGFQGAFVRFDKPSMVYSPGETVSGKVYLDSNGPDQINGLNVDVVGDAYVHFLRRASSDSVKIGHHERNNGENYFSAILYAYTGYALPGGRSEFPFSFNLPMNIPSSFKVQYGQVEYKVRVAVHHPLQTFQTFGEFTVLVPLDLNLVPGATNPAMAFNQWDVGFLCCTKHIRATLKIYRGGFCSGEEIPFECEINNPSGAIILGCAVTLVQDSFFQAAAFRKNTKTNQAAIITVKKERTDPRMKQDVWRGSLVQFQNLLLPPTNLGGPFCRMIRVDYRVQLELKLTEVRDLFTPGYVVSIPVVIGTIPLVSVNPPIPGSS